MIYNIINTIGTRFLIALFSLSLLLLNSNYLGVSGLGTVGLIILGITIILLVSNLVNGGGLIYYASKYSNYQLCTISYIWIAITGILFIPILILTPLFVEGYGWDILILGALLSAISTHNHLLLGHEKVKWYNFISLFQALVQLLVLLYFFIIKNEKTVDSFIISTYIAYIFSFIISFIILVTTSFESKKHDHMAVTGLLKKVLNYGFYLQLANIFQLLNYRLSYFLLQFYSGVAAVGAFTPGVQLSEGILLPTKSLATVQYARISNLEKKSDAVRLTLSLMKISVCITIPVIIIILLLPSSLFTSVFGEEFNQVKPVMGALSIGILCLSMEGILSRFFSGTGRQKTNSTSAFIGLIFTIISGFLLIPSFGIMGAAYTASISYFSMFIFMLIQLNKQANISIKDYIPNKNDFNLMKLAVKNRLKKRAKD